VDLIKKIVCFSGCHFYGGVQPDWRVLGHGW